MRANHTSLFINIIIILPSNKATRKTNFNNLHVGLADDNGPIIGVVSPYGDHSKRIGRAHEAAQILEFLGRQV
jgi:hypothetical protein